MSRPVQVVGVDAGGTGTRALALDLGTGARSEARAGGANWTVHGPELCRERIEEAVGAAAPDGFAALCLCLAGFFPQDHREEVERWVAARWPCVSARVEQDLTAAWAGAFGGMPGIVLISGTGSVCYGRNSRGQEARAGGWGPLFDDRGSAYRVGVAALAAVAGSIDGLAPRTLLAERFPERWPELGSEPTVWLRGVYRCGWGREEIAALAEAVAEAAREGDRVAEAILRAACDDLARLAAAVRERLGEPDLPIALQGGFALSSAVAGPLRAALRRRAPGLRATPALFRPVEGAALLAAGALGRTDAGALLAPARA